MIKFLKWKNLGMLFGFLCMSEAYSGRQLEEKLRKSILCLDISDFYDINRDLKNNKTINLEEGEYQMIFPAGGLHRNTKVEGSYFWEILTYFPEMNHIQARSHLMIEKYKSKIKNNNEKMLNAYSKLIELKLEGPQKIQQVCEQDEKLTDISDLSKKILHPLAECQNIFTLSLANTYELNKENPLMDQGHFKFYFGLEKIKECTKEDKIKVKRYKKINKNIYEKNNEKKYKKINQKINQNIEEAFEKMKIE